MILNKKQMLNSSISGTDCNLSIVGCFQIIQDAITEMMGLNKVDGVTVKEKYNAFWVFTKTRAKFLKKLAWNNEIFITCYISNISLARINVDVEIKNKNGELAVHSRTELCVLDILTQRFKRVSAVGVDETMLENNTSDEIEFAKFEDIESPIVEEVKVRSTNIDFSHHTNNTEYIRLIMNTYSVSEMESKQIKEIEILYVNQSFENDILSIRKANFNDKDIILIEKSNKPIVKCEIVY